MLPPAMDRDVAEEARVAASLFRPSSRPLFQPVEGQNDKEKRIVLLTQTDASTDRLQQLALELVSNITSGKRSGTTWAKPVALRTTSNITMALSAFRFDSTLGWIDSPSGAVASEVHIFSALAPAIFVPTARLEPIPAELALAVRTLAEVHAAVDLSSVLQGEAALLHAFARLMHNDEWLD